MSTNEVHRPRGIPTLIAYAVHVGVQPFELLSAVGLDPSQFRGEEVALPHAQKMRLWDEAARLAGDPDFGLHLAEWACLHLEEHFDVLTYALRSYATLGEHYKRMERYVRLVYEGTFFSLEVDAKEARLVHGLLDGSLPPRHPVESMLTAALLHGRQAVGDDYAPREVHFAHPAPARTDEQERVFRAPVFYGRPRNLLVIDPAHLDLRQRHAEPRLASVLERQLEGLLSQLRTDRSFPGQVKRCMVELLLNGEPALHAVAGKLKMSSRSLQRKLKEEGTTFAELLSNVRREMALRHLDNPAMSIKEVAFLLGFAEVPAFHRAFKRWTGHTPAGHRRNGHEYSGPLSNPAK